MYVAYHILTIPCLVMPWRLEIQAINRHGIDTQTRNIPSPASEELILLTHFQVAPEIKDSISTL